MRINITQRDIDRGSKSSPCGCALALAANRASGRVTSVAPTQLFITAKPIDLPKEACEFVARFDAGLQVQPFAFELEGL